ncbi:MAG: FHA domain-containing protein, partial [Eubacteriales bacterium]|nr:FHA domain-containing protein [Eubacteriales bacterium]
VAESTPAPETEEEPAAEPTSAPETEEESEEGLIDRVMDFVKENIIICVATGFVLVALIIILVMVVRKKKGAGSSDIVEPLGNGDPLTENGIDKTLGDPTYSDEATIGAYDNDDEETVDGSQERGLRLQFEITFGGRKETVERILGEELVLGRGNECDVDVVLSSTAEERKQTSRKHAVILNRPDGLYIKDTSRNKTYLNGVEVAEESALRDEDILQLGKASVKVRILGE